MNDLEFQRGLRETFQSPTGKAVLEFLENVYVNTSVMNSDPNIVFYRLGQKELVQGLVKDALSTEDLKPINVIQEDE